MGSHRPFGWNARSWDSRALVADGFDAVAVQVDDEGRVIVRVIMRTQARPAIVGSAGGERGSVKLVDRQARPCQAGDMRARRLGDRRAERGQPEVRPLRRAIAGPTV